MPSYTCEIPIIPVSEMNLSSAKKRYSMLGEQAGTPLQGHQRDYQPLRYKRK